MNSPERVHDNPPDASPVDAIEHWRRFAPDLPEDKVLFSERVPGGGHWSYRLPRGTTLRIVALDAGANLSLVLYSAQEKLERYNMPDSLKAQHTAHYTKGNVLMSDMGRALASITADTLGYLSEEGLVKATGLKHSFCTACWSGDYRVAPTGGDPAQAPLFPLADDER